MAAAQRVPGRRGYQASSSGGGGAPVAEGAPGTVRTGPLGLTQCHLLCCWGARAGGSLINKKKIKSEDGIGIKRGEGMAWSCVLERHPSRWLGGGCSEDGTCLPFTVTSGTE